MNDMKLKAARVLLKLADRMNEEYNVRKSDGFLKNKQVEPCVLLQSYFLLIDFMIESSSFKGKIIDFSGDNTITKATVYYYAIAKAQETWSDIPAAIIDTENSFKLKDAQKSGVNIGKLLVSLGINDFFQHF